MSLKSRRLADTSESWRYVDLGLGDHAIRRLNKLAIVLCLLIPVAAGGYFGLLSRERETDLAERVGPVTRGMTQEQLLRQAGPPDSKCRNPKGAYLALGASSYWIYRSVSDRTVKSPCEIRYRDTVVGFSEKGEALWYQRRAGEEPIRSDR